MYEEEINDKDGNKDSAMARTGEGQGQGVAQQQWKHIMYEQTQNKDKI